METGFLKVDGSMYPRSKYFTGNVLTALIEADTWDSNGRKRYGLMPSKFSWSEQCGKNSVSNAYEFN
jgi:hypothetical protein